MKKVTSFTHFTTGEGERIAYTYSDIDDAGRIVSQNNKGSFIVLDDSLTDHIKAIVECIKTKLEV